MLRRDPATRLHPNWLRLPRRAARHGGEPARDEGGEAMTDEQEAAGVWHISPFASGRSSTVAICKCLDGMHLAEFLVAVITSHDEQVLPTILDDHARAQAAAALLADANALAAALKERCGGCFRGMPLEEGFFDGDRWHVDGVQRTRCMNSARARLALEAHAAVIEAWR